jgi:uncharacterized protein UPF0236
VTCLGALTLSRHRWGNRCPCAVDEGYHVDDAIGLDGYLSRRLQRQACRKAADGSFEKASEDLFEFLGVHVCAETLRKVSEEHGRRMASWQPNDEPSAQAFAAAAGAVEFTVDAGKVNTREEGWKDAKIVVVQKRPSGEPATVEAWDKQRLPAATARLAWGEIATSNRFRRSWRTRLRTLGVEQMSEVHVLGDGASWIWKSADRVLTGSLQTLDIYHALEHVAEAGQRLYGEGTDEAKAFLERGRVGLLTDGWTGLCRLVNEEYANGDMPARRKTLEKLVSYFVKHMTRLSYADRLRSGQAIGSGVVEGQAKTLGLRLKARGARWRKTNVKSMMALVCVRNSDAWSNYWGQAA